MSIEQLMHQKSDNTHLITRYISFISSCTTKNITTDDTTENHHILPKCKGFWPEYKNLREYPWNSSQLTYRQHIIAHIMLAKIFKGKMWTALWSMVNGKGKKYRSPLDINTKMYAKLREEASKQHSDYMRNIFWTDEKREIYSEKYKGENNPFYGKVHNDEIMQKLIELNTGKIVSEETRLKIGNSIRGRTHSEESIEKMSKIQKGKNNSFYGKKHSEESIEKIRISSTGRPSKRKGIPISQEVKDKISKSQKGICRNLDVECPHCGKVGKSSGMNVWHFSKCPKNPDNINKNTRIRSQETKDRMSKSKKGKPSTKKYKKDKVVKCPFCEKEGGQSIMKRWHFDNCKMK